MGKKASEEASRKIGGLALYLAVIAFMALAFISLLALPALIAAVSGARAAAAILGVVGGAIFATLFIRGRVAVFIHELKHSILSSLCGNRAKRMVYADESGAFEFRYSKATAHLNAFISLAPYWLPVFTAPVALAAALLLREWPIAIAISIGVAYGIDLALGFRDISPYQTDFSDLRGGLIIGLLYLIPLHIVMAVVVFAGATMGAEGLVLLKNTLVQTLFLVAAKYHPLPK